MCRRRAFTAFPNGKEVPPRQQRKSKKELETSRVHGGRERAVTSHYITDFCLLKTEKQSKSSTAFIVTHKSMLARLHFLSSGDLWGRRIDQCYQAETVQGYCMQSNTGVSTSGNVWSKNLSLCNILNLYTGDARNILDAHHRQHGYPPKAYFSVCSESEYLQADAAGYKAGDGDL